MEKFNKNELTEAEEKYLDSLIAQGKLSLEDFEELQSIGQSLDIIMDASPSRQMDATFYTMLGEQKAKANRRNWLKNWFVKMPVGLQYALPVMLLLVGFFAGRSFNDVPGVTEIPQEQQTLTTLIQSRSTSDRIMAVKEVSRSSQAEGEITKALLFSLNNDKSDNVRIASIEALLKYSNHESVRSGLIDAIRFQDSPLVLLNLAEALKILGNDIPIDQYKNMLNKDLPPKTVKSIEEGLKLIKT